MSTSPLRTHRFESLGALRGVLALMLALYHFPPIFFGADNPLVRHSSVLTNLFFAIGGFMLMAAYGDKIRSVADYGGFLKKRFLRMYPMFVLTTGLTLAVPFVAYAVNWALTWMLAGKYIGDFAYPAVPWTEVAGDLLLLQGMGVFDNLHLNFPSWSMAVLFICGLGFGALVPFRRVRLGFFALLGVAAVVVLARNSTAYMSSTYDYGFVRCVANFMVGALCHAVWQSWKPSEAVLRWTVLLQTTSLLVLVGFMTWVRVDSPASLLTPLVCGQFLLAFSIDRGDYAELLQHKAFHWLSERSFSMFLLQASLLFIGALASEWLAYFELNGGVSRLLGTGALALYLAILLLVSDWAYRRVERRFLP